MEKSSDSTFVIFILEISKFRIIGCFTFGRSKYWPTPFFRTLFGHAPSPPPPPPKWGWKKQMKKILFGFGFVWKKFCSPFHFMRKILHLFFFFFSILYPSIYKRLISTLDTPIFRREFHPSNGFFEYIQKKILVILVLGLLKHISK